jgi:arylsulfatase A-like enzyme
MCRGFGSYSVALAVLFGLVGRSAGQEIAARSVPNIILIVADDLGFSDLGCYGSEILTPNLDKLAKGGLRCTQFYNGGRSSASRAALLTGLYAQQTGVGHLLDDYRRPGYRGNLNKQCATLAELLRVAGYQTFACGKWHLTRYTAPEGPKFNWPQQRGFDKFYGTIAGAGSYFDPVTLTRDNSFVRDTGGAYYYTDAISQRAADFVEAAAKSDKPFFLYVAYSAPHSPLQAPPEVVARYRAKYATGWDALRKERHTRMIGFGLVKKQWPLTPRDPRVRDWERNTYKEWHQRRMEVYAAQVDLMDQGVGRIVERVRQSGIQQRTLVMFLSAGGACDEEVAADASGLHIPTKTRDGRSIQVGNNPNLMPGPENTYQSYGIAWANASNTPLRLYSRFVHEGGIATPLIVYWPAVIKQGGGLVHDVGHVIDIVPTCLEVAKSTYPKTLASFPLTPLSGESMLPILQGRSRRRGPLFWEHEGNRAVRDGKWKLVARHPDAWELYDMEADRTETNDLAHNFPVMVKDLSQMYEAWAKRCNVEPWKRAPEP